MTPYILSNVTGITPLTVIMTILEFSTVILFAIGGFFYYLITRRTNNKKARVLAIIGVIVSFIGGIPNAVDKMCWTFFSYDTVFNSTWLFFFVGIGYVLLFISSLLLHKEHKSFGEKTMSVAILASVPAFHKPMKYVSMLAASVGMVGFYITMFIETKKKIGWLALFYFVTLGCTVFLIVFSAVGKFSGPIPNIIAQSVNSLGYLALIIANKLYLKRI